MTFIAQFLSKGIYCSYCTTKTPQASGNLPFLLPNKKTCSSTPQAGTAGRTTPLCRFGACRMLESSSAVMSPTSSSAIHLGQLGCHRRPLLLLVCLVCLFVWLLLFVVVIMVLFLAPLGGLFSCLNQTPWSLRGFGASNVVFVVWSFSWRFLVQICFVVCLCLFVQVQRREDKV